MSDQIATLEVQGLREVYTFSYHPISGFFPFLESIKGTRRIISQFLPSNPGVYLFLKINIHQKWEIIYIGQTDDLNNHLLDVSKHKSWDCIDKNGATHLAILPTRLDKKIYGELKTIYEPICNK